MLKDYLFKEVQILFVAEGFKDIPYQDHKGFWTWGIGRNYQGYPLTLAERDYLKQICGTDIHTTPEWSIKYTTDVLLSIPKNKCRMVADYFVMQVLTEIDNRLVSAWGRYSEMEDARKCAILDLSYNMGLGLVMTFKRTLKMIEDEDYAGAADYILTWPYAYEVGKNPPTTDNPYGQRAWYITEMIRTGEFPKWVR